MVVVIFLWFGGNCVKWNCHQVEEEIKGDTLKLDFTFPDKDIIQDLKMGM